MRIDVFDYEHVKPVAVLLVPPDVDTDELYEMLRSLNLVPGPPGLLEFITNEEGDATFVFDSVAGSSILELRYTESTKEKKSGSK